MPTQLLEKAFLQASQLPGDKQDTLATLLLDEIAIVNQWDKSFDQSQDMLSRMAHEALSEHLEGKTQPLNSEML